MSICRAEQRATYENGQPVWRGAFQSKRVDGACRWETWTTVRRFAAQSKPDDYREYETVFDEESAERVFEQARIDVGAGTSFDESASRN